MLSPAPHFVPGEDEEMIEETEEEENEEEEEGEEDGVERRFGLRSIRH